MGPPFFASGERAMAVTIEKLNDDTTFLLAFAPAFAPQTKARRHFPGAYTILLDPWLCGSSSMLHPTFHVSHHTAESAVRSLADLDAPPDLIIVSQDKADHCHRETLCTLPPHTSARVLATPAAARKIKSWGHFDADVVEVIKPYSPSSPRSVLRIALPAYTSTSSAGEITIANIPTRRDLTALHNAIGITYRAPGSLLSTEKTLSIIYTPHGISLPTLRPYLDHHLRRITSAHLTPKYTSTDPPPITALFHSLNTEQNPWFMGGLVAHGAPKGIELANALRPKHWIGAHDEQKDNRGISVSWIKSRQYSAKAVQAMLEEGEVAGEDIGCSVKCMGVGEVFRVEG
ncbi:hypothetical protein EJ03DRAFT_277038 [Teratosphaeria nubilosa]|uniref:Metallo-beta-lactamase domain-containing protein n=1 Tax=Teratosphaeria nubilosa TaxID=161662 RepID=A0A6G1L345_9PEZI|nr:hypothetical protein EJ03DRAFT_277038 [Teratosphaeria nubilosa]